MPLERFGPYELVRPLGAGGMAETFLAVRRGPGQGEQRVCIKRILPKYTGETAIVDQFLDEARLLGQLRYPGIVQVHDSGVIAGSYYMALELVDGADLEQLCKSLRAGERLPTEVSLFIATKLLEALSYAHRATLAGEPLCVVHRDVSPSNILLSKQGEVKLTDFGIAKSAHRRHKTKTGRTKGKLAYMSPEQVRGELLDARSDLFAMGIVLYELLAGVHPFEASTDFALLQNIVTSTHRYLGAAAPDIDPRVVRCVERLLSADAADRYASAEACLADLPALTKPQVCQRMLADSVARYVATRSDREPSAPTPIRDAKLAVKEVAETRDLPAAKGPQAGGGGPSEARSRAGDQATPPTSMRNGKPPQPARVAVWQVGLVALAVAVLGAFSLWHFWSQADRGGTGAPVAQTKSASHLPSESLPAPARASVAPEPPQTPKTIDDEGVLDLAESPDVEGARDLSGANEPEPEIDSSESGRKRARRQRPQTTDAPENLQDPIPPRARRSVRSGVEVSVEDF